MDNKYKKIVIAPLLFALSIALIFAENVNAVDPITDTTTFQVSVTDFLTLTLDQSDNIAHLSSSTRFNTGSIVASVATNNAAGYTLSFIDKDDRNGLERSGYSSASVEDKPLYNIPSVVSATTYANLTDDTYGYFLGSTTATEATYLPIPLTSTEIDSSDGPTAPAASTTINFGVKISATRPHGTYQDTVVISAVANIGSISLEESYAAAHKTKVTVSGDQYYVMQDMNSSICEATTEIPSELQVVDIRDNKIYWIAKLADGKCWMTQNLDLDLETTPNHVLALTSENTDLNTYGSNGYDTNYGYSKDTNNVITWTPVRNTIPVSSISTNGTITGWSADCTSSYSIDTGNWYWIGNWKNNGTDTWYSSTTSNYLDIDSSGAGDKFSTIEYTGNGKHDHVGNYYNWSAAIASNNSTSYTANTRSNISNNPQNSICPAGWRLPTISNASDTDGSTNEFRRLVTLYGNTTDNDKALTASPLWFVRGGSVYGNSLRNSGNRGLYWSSTVYDNIAVAYTLNFYSSVVYPTDVNSRDAGWSVRCVAH